MWLFLRRGSLFGVVGRRLEGFGVESCELLIGFEGWLGWIIREMEMENDGIGRGYWMNRSSPGQCSGDIA